ncbi:MAG: crossover junction endodeoxyribonuclease RuvC [Clostridia bacterium]|nr:crossover junction endodeoxyribonuclease RuvC [Clostridia bacterium]
MRILGIDPGLATIGWGVIDTTGVKHKALAYGAIITPSGTPTEKRLALIFAELEAIIKKYQPEVMAVEELFFNTNITTGIRVAEARGVILLCAERCGIELAEYTPLQVKQAVVGYGRAEKKQVITMVTMLLGLPKPPSPDDTADALAIAVCHAHTGGSRIAKYYNGRL